MPCDVDGATFKGKLSITTGTQSSTVVVLDSQVQGKVSITGGADRDDVFLKNVTSASDVSVKTAGENDRVGVVGGDQAGSLTIDAGKVTAVGAADQVAVSGLAIAKNLTVKTSNGNDVVGIGTGEAVDQVLADWATALGIDVAPLLGPVLNVVTVKITTGLGDDLVGIVGGLAQRLASIRARGSTRRGSKPSRATY